MIKHTIKPVYDNSSEILILGSFPSIKSREEGFFYGHKSNRFWRVLANIFNLEVPDTVERKKALLLNNKIALWDVIAYCDIEGSSDSTIKNVVPNDLSKIFNEADIRLIITNGKKADELYCKYLEDVTKIKAVCLPSTSPANASWSIERLTEKWSETICNK